ncbi:hypothetical protein O181_066569 [Austropuccinia psidii MF-1]|uniref:Reverse transcriptase Ty1/copia-type domain-containing protein n=1 Tax=Austropuccinia psidii MF-1 TaxID=1389203 RepID=A0A9Q3I5N7_9BASI|nr:hypothetical protein [Austropuccinia psidii MF-1]
MPGVDFHKTYSPTGQLNSLCSLIAMAATRHLQFHQVDVKSAFLNAPFVETVYLAIPQGMSTKKQKYCLKLWKAIYGLKQEPLAWYERLKSWLTKVGFHACLMGPCVFFHQEPSKVWLYIHVDDIAIFGANIKPFKKKISSEFNIRDIGTNDLLIGVKITHSPDYLSLDQQHLLSRFLTYMECQTASRHQPHCFQMGTCPLPLMKKFLPSTLWESSIAVQLGVSIILAPRHGLTYPLRSAPSHNSLSVLVFFTERRSCMFYNIYREHLA